MKGWHILRDGAALTLARRVPVRFDLAVRTHLAADRRLRAAQQVRQDVWRALKSLRGFSPVVRVERVEHGLAVTAGGQVDGPFARDSAEARIADVLEDPVNRARWVRCAR